jgi:hypothetical protein
MTDRLTHADIQRIIAGADDACDMMDVRIDGFCLWPVVKVALWRFLTNMYVAERGGTNDSLLQPGRLSRLRKFLRVALRSSYYLARGQLFLALHGRDIPKKSTFLIYADRMTTTRDGRPFQNYLGDLVVDAINITDRGTFHDAPAFTLATHYFNALALMRMGLKLVFHTYPREFYDAVDMLRVRLAQYGHGCEKLSRIMTILAAAHFCEMRHVYESFFKKYRPKAVVLTDFDAVFGIVAAARARGVPVYDMQHGTFWSGDLDHSWTKKHCEMSRQSMPFPDKLLVFGDFWRDIALEQGFWNEADVICVGSPSMDVYREHRKPASGYTPHAPFEILFVSGDIRPNSVAHFLDTFMALVRGKLKDGIHLKLRLHPREVDLAHLYRDICEKYDDMVSLGLSDRPILQDALKADLVIGTATTAMLECLLLGVPVISLGAGAIPEGIAAIHNNALLRELVAHAPTPQDLLDKVGALREHPEHTRPRLARVEELQDHFYKRGYTETMRKLLGS